MKNVSILGCGWLGLPLGDELVKQGYHVNGSVTKEYKVETLRSVGIQPYLFDWAEKEIPSEFFNCDVMIITVPPSTANYKDNFQAFVQSMEVNGVEKVIYTSASSVYPDNNTIVIEEDAEMIISPHSGLALLEIENLIRDSQAFDTTILRFAGLYGPDRIPGKFLAGKKNISGANKLVNLIHRDDCLGIIIQILTHNVWNETFNACSDFHPSRKEFYTAACLSRNLKVPEFNEETKDYKIVNSDKLKTMLGYKFIHANPMDDL